MVDRSDDPLTGISGIRGQILPPEDLWLILMSVCHCWWDVAEESPTSMKVRRWGASSTKG